MTRSQTDNASTEDDPINDVGPGWQRRFWSIFCGQGLSLVGSALTQFVLLWWITDTTGSVSALATAGMAALLPQALLSPLGGTFADRYSRRVLMMAADTISAVCMMVLIALFLTSRIELWHVYTMMAIRSAMQAFQSPAAAASVAMLVPYHFLPRAAGLNQTVQGLTLVASAPLGALAIGILPLGWALSIDVFTALLGIVPLMIYRVPQVFKAGKNGMGNLWHEFHEGFNVIWQNRGLRYLFVLIGAVALAIMPTFTLAPLLVKEHFLGNATQVAWMEGFAGVGIIAGGLIVAAIAPRRLLLWILSGFALSCLSIAFTGLAPASLFGIAIAWWTISGLTFILGEAPFITLLQTTIPNHMQGRALSLLNMVVGLSAPVGLVLLIPFGEMIGVRWLFVTVGTLGAIISLLGFLSRDIRKLDLQRKPSRSSSGR